MTFPDFLPYAESVILILDEIKKTATENPVAVLLF